MPTKYGIMTTTYPHLLCIPIITLVAAIIATSLILSRFPPVAFVAAPSTVAPCRARNQKRNIRSPIMGAARPPGRAAPGRWSGSGWHPGLCLRQGGDTRRTTTARPRAGRGRSPPDWPPLPLQPPAASLGQQPPGLAYPRVRGVPQRGTSSASGTSMGTSDLSGRGRGWPCGVSAAAPSPGTLQRGHQLPGRQLG